MNKRSAIGGIAVAAAVALAILVGVGKAHTPTHTTIVLFESEKTTKVSVVDQAPTSKTGALSVGDEFIFFTPLYDKARKRIGTAYGKATVAVATKNPDKSRFVNDIVIALHGGTINAHGLFTGGKLNSYAIAGGTGVYEGARGTFTETKQGDLLKLLP